MGELNRQRPPMGFLRTFKATNTSIQIKWKTLCITAINFCHTAAILVLAGRNFFIRRIHYRYFRTMDRICIDQSLKSSTYLNCQPLQEPRRRALGHVLQ
jgi:hypothetical protein